VVTVSRWVQVIVAAMATTTLLAGCGSESAPDNAPVQGTANGQPDPCSLLTPKQVATLAVDKGQRQQDANGFFCTWSNRPPGSGSVYTGRIIGAPLPAGDAAPSIAGFPTSRIAPGGLDPKRSCVYLLSVGKDQGLWAQYVRSTGNLTHQIACQKAQALAALLATSYRGHPS
jgi:hypothetical protein